MIDADLVEAHDSSPRVRGTRQCRPVQRVSVRFIPACAGNTRTAGGTPWNCGSSPRVRGTHSTALRIVSSTGFIPACAGNTVPTMRTDNGQSVHPRVCGEHRSDSHRPDRGAGSSPRVRGTRLCRTHVSGAVRFIPACAGNTARRHAARPGAQVHPRVCGEHVPQHGMGNLPHGFIPACAGNTSALTWRQMLI